MSIECTKRQPWPTSSGCHPQTRDVTNNVEINNYPVILYVTEKHKKGSGQKLNLMFLMEKLVSGVNLVMTEVPGLCSTQAARGHFEGKGCKYHQHREQCKNGLGLWS